MSSITSLPRSYPSFAPFSPHHLTKTMSQQQQQQQQPKRPAKLDLSAFDPAKEGAKSSGDAKPSSITFVVSGSAPVKTIDGLTKKWWSDGVFGQQDLKLRALVYELNQSDKGVDATPQEFQAGRVRQGVLDDGNWGLTPFCTHIFRSPARTCPSL